MKCRSTPLLRMVSRYRRSRIAACDTTQDNGELIAAHPGHGVNLTQ